MNKISANQKALLAVYRQAVTKFRKEPCNQFCALCMFEGKMRKVEDNHHIAGKKWKERYVDQRLFLSVCRNHHNWIEDNKSRARAMMLICPSGMSHTDKAAEWIETCGLRDKINEAYALLR